MAIKTRNHSDILKNIASGFPILKQKIRGKPLIYFDNAATTQKPQCVIDSLCQYYSESNANVHRGIHYLSEKATIQFEQTREIVKNFINAKKTCECIFVDGTTEAINLVATSFGDAFIQEEDEIVITAMEHHANIVPWQMLCQRKKAKLRVLPISPQGELLIEELDSFLTEKTKILSITHVSNALGTVNPLKSIIQKAKQKGIKVLVDGAQAAAHIKIDVQDLDCDFYAFSGHKIYGPTGIGVLYGKEELLNAMPPYQGGGEMISKVTFEKTTYNELPFKFEAGTPAIAEVFALGSALNFISKIGFNTIEAHEQALLKYAVSELKQFSGITLIGEPHKRTSVISFIMDNIHPHDIATILDQEGISIRAGHHCAMPLLDFLNVHATARISFGVYNTKQEIDSFIQALHHVQQFFKR